MNYVFINNDLFCVVEFVEMVYKEFGNDIFWKFYEFFYKK